MTNPTFRVLNPDGSEPDLAKITDKERWARCIDWRDVEGQPSRRMAMLCCLTDWET